MGVSSRYAKSELGVGYFFPIGEIYGCRESNGFFMSFVYPFMVRSWFPISHRAVGVYDACVVHVEFSICFYNEGCPYFVLVELSFA